jgi:hypothetical protein
MTPLASTLLAILAALVLARTAGRLFSLVGRDF